MPTYDFTFVVDADPYADDFEDRFIETGCDDATFVLRRGAAAICFDRSANSYKEAVLSAYRNIKDAGSNILRFEPDFLVSQNEISERAHLSRSAVGLFEKGERREGFPLPVAKISSPRPLWDWVAVSQWLVANGKLDESEYRHALISRTINVDAQIRLVTPDHEFDVEAVLANV
ncbi:hypothetical protein [Pseudooceanicola nanhaiensis]|uniref:hypothetical protein n=1 Tax=Pseudooceanicola nanhaiensis TaxID=375761 RepID=UPI0030082FED